MTLCHYCRDTDLVDFLELDLEDERSIRWDESWEATIAIRHLARDRQNASFAQRHLWHTLVPASDDSADTDGGLEVSTADRAVESGAVSIEMR